MSYMPTRACLLFYRWASEPHSASRVLCKLGSVMDKCEGAVRSSCRIPGYQWPSPPQRNNSCLSTCVLSAVISVCPHPYLRGCSSSRPAPQPSLCLSLHSSSLRGSAQPPPCSAGKKDVRSIGHR